MPPAHILLQLAQHHQAISAQMGVAIGLLRETARDPVALGNVRWKMARLLGGYRLFKQLHVIDPAVRQNGPRRDADRLRAEAEAIDAAYRAHLTKWSSGGITGREDEHAADSKAMLDKLQAHIAQDKRGIEALLGQNSSRA